MVGGTKLPPQDSASEPWQHEQAKQKQQQQQRQQQRQLQKQKLNEGESQKPSPVHVSLDNADTVIEGGPRFAVFQTWEAPLATILPSLPPVPQLLHNFREPLHGGVVLATLLLGLFDHVVEELPRRILWW